MDFIVDREIRLWEMKQGCIGVLGVKSMGLKRVVGFYESRATGNN